MNIGTDPWTGARFLPNITGIRYGTLPISSKTRTSFCSLEWLLVRHDAVFHRVVQLGARIHAVPAAIGTISAALQLLVQSRASTPVCQRYHFGR